MGKILFVSGIDTDCGKTVATGLLARSMMGTNRNVITLKMVQTGCQSISSDIVVHRELMGTGLLDVDRNGSTCPYLFQFPASPMLAAQLSGEAIDTAKIEALTASLSSKFDVVLVEGAGGLHVPLNPRQNIIDYVGQRSDPLVLVSSAKLGSINHTLLSIEVCKSRGIKIAGVVFNAFFQENQEIIDDSRTVIGEFLKKCYPNAIFLDMPKLSRDSNFVFPGIDILINQL